jgi:hypothetical protein
VLDPAKIASDADVVSNPCLETIAKDGSCLNELNRKKIKRTVDPSPRSEYYHQPSQEPSV